MGRAILSKSLIQFSVDVWGCVPSLLFDLGQTMVEVMKIMATSFKRSQHALLHSLSPTLQQATADPCLCQRLLDTQASLGQSLVGSLLLSPGSWWAQGFVCASQESVSPALCKFWQLYGGVNGNLMDT